MNIYHQAAMQRRIEELEVENARLRGMLRLREKPSNAALNTLSEEAQARKEFLDNVKPLGYTSARAYIEAMADKYGVDVENARQAFLNCGYEEWNTGFIETLMEMMEMKERK